MRDKGTKTCNPQGTILAEQSYQLNTNNPTQMPTPSEIKIESKRTKQKINGYLKIHKNTQLYTNNTGTVIALQSPTLITDENLE